MYSKSKRLAYAGLMTALTTISTAALAIPTPFTGGYIHLGDAMVLSCGVVLGKKYGALAAGIGSALADLLLGYTQWVLPTLVIKGLMAFIIGYLFETPNNKKRHLLIAGICLTSWVAFHSILRHLLTPSIVSNQATPMINDGLIATSSAALPLATTTQNILFIAALVLPIILILLFLFSRKKRSLSTWMHRSIAFISAGSFMVIFYYLTYGILYGNWILPIFSIVGNTVQYISGVVIGLALLPLTSKFSLTTQKTL